MALGAVGLGYMMTCGGWCGDVMMLRFAMFDISACPDDALMCHKVFQNMYRNHDGSWIIRVYCRRDDNLWNGLCFRTAHTDVWQASHAWSAYVQTAWNIQKV